jgi:hypothetical protein
MSKKQNNDGPVRYGETLRESVDHDRRDLDVTEIIDLGRVLTEANRRQWPKLNPPHPLADAIRKDGT